MVLLNNVVVDVKVGAFSLWSVGAVDSRRNHLDSPPRISGEFFSYRD